MPNHITERIQKIRERLGKSDIDTFWVLAEENRYYLSGFRGEDGQFDESAGVLFITADRCVLATDSRFELQARAEASDFEVVCYRKSLADSISGIFADLKTRKVGFEGIRMSVAQHEKIAGRLKEDGLSVQMTSTEGWVEELRSIKTEAEIQTIRKALNLAETAFSNILSGIKPGVTEKQLAWALEKAMREAGADGLSFPVIAAAGPNSALPHAIAGNRPIEAGEPILLDWGARLDGYCSDISRTLIRGTPDKNFQSRYAIVREAQQKAIESIRPGIGGREVDQIARNHIARMGYGKYFGHGLGHGVGLRVHEHPRLGPSSDQTLVPGMVATVEPGIYLPQWGGIRIENMVWIREDGPEVLNSLDTAMTCLE